MAPERRQRGFTLIEVVVAMAIVALGMMAVFRVVQDTINNSTYLRDRTFATWIADNQLVEMRLGTALPSVDQTSGEVKFANESWHWEATVSETQVPDLRRIDVRVRRATDPDKSTLSEVSGFVGQVMMTTPPSGTPWTGVAAGTGSDAEGDGNAGQGTPPATNPPASQTPAQPVTSAVEPQSNPGGDG